MAGRKIVVSGHALLRLAERWPGIGEQTERLWELIVFEVLDALANQRLSTHEPSFLRYAGRVGKRNGSERDRTLRYCWTGDEQRVYLLDKRSRTLTVVTTLRPDRDSLNA